MNSFTTKAQEAKADTIVFTTVDVPAVFPGGLEGWRRYLKRNLEYPAEAFKKDVEGVVRVQMIISKNGNISEVKSLNNSDGGLAEEAERVKEGPKWVPAELK